MAIWLCMIASLIFLVTNKVEDGNDELSMARVSRRGVYIDIIYVRMTS